MWTDPEGRIWFKALVSLIVLAIIGVWVYICIRTRTFTPLEWSHVGLILGGLGITMAPNFLSNEKSP